MLIKWALQNITILLTLSTVWYKHKKNQYKFRITQLEVEEQHIVYLLYFSALHSCVRSTCLLCPNIFWHPVELKSSPSLPPLCSGDSDRLVCLEDGLWSFPEAYCKIECPEVPNIPNAKLLTADCLASGHDVGSVCRYKCKTGFYVTGSLKRKTPR